MAFTEKLFLLLFMVAFTADEASSGKFRWDLFTLLSTDHYKVEKLLKPVLAQIFVIFQTMGHITILKTTIRAASVAQCIIENAVATYTTISLRGLTAQNYQQKRPARTNKQMWIFWRNVKTGVTRTLDVRDTSYIMCHKTGFASVSSQQIRPVSELKLCLHMLMLTLLTLITP